MKYIIGQIIGIVAVILTFISYQTKESKKLLTIQTFSTAAFIIHYFLIGASSGFLLNIVCVIRNLIYYFKNVKLFSYPFYPYLLAAVLALLGVMSWQGPISLLIITALMINTVCLSIDDTQFLRKSVILTCSMILVYNIFVRSYGGMINESIAIISSAIGIYRYRKQS